MGLSPVHWQAPGIQAMEKGQPWTINSSHFYQRPAKTPLQLESIQTIMQSSERLSALPMSPSSVTSETLRGPIASLQPSKHLKTELIESCTGELTRSECNAIPLRLPDVAKISRGGCFDTNDWVFKIVWDHVQHMDLEQLLTNFFQREDRGKYGEHHTSTRGAPDIGLFDDDIVYKGKGTESHRQQEQGRRVRHRYLQAGSDQCISTFILDIAQKELPRIKRAIQKMHEQSKMSNRPGADHANQESEKIQSANPAFKKLGKDDQLTAVLMSQYVAFILISRLQEHLSYAQHEIEALSKQVCSLQITLDDANDRTEDFRSNEKHEQMQSELTYWRHKYEQSESEKITLREEIASLKMQRNQNGKHRRSQTVLYPPSSVSSPHNGSSRKRKSFARFKPQSTATSFPQRTSDMEQAKWQHNVSEPPSINIQVDKRYRLPPSPTPSCDSPLFSSCTPTDGPFDNADWSSVPQTVTTRSPI